MKDKFPEIYKSKIDKIKTKVQKDFYYHSGENEQRNSSKQISSSELINKINNIFLRSDYVYQADVNILYKNGENINKKIIGFKDNYLLTFDGQKISIDDIYDIK